MLIQNVGWYKREIVTIMSDLAVITASTKVSLLEISKQASALGIGLQNAAPGEREGALNTSVQYLLEIAAELHKKAESCGNLLITITSQNSD